MGSLNVSQLESPVWLMSVLASILVLLDQIKARWVIFSPTMSHRSLGCITERNFSSTRFLGSVTPCNFCIECN